MLIENLSINVTPGGVPVIIPISQYDIGLRTFVFSPYTSHGTFTPDAAAAATLEGTKPDGNIIVHNCQYNASTGEITYIVQEQLAAVSGRVWSKLTIRDTSGGVIGYAAIIWMVDMAGVENGAIASDSDISALQEFIAEFGTINAYKAALDGALAAVGGPYVASTVSQMTDHSKVYVYTGSQTGYTAGHWYYWNGSAWTDGGVYQAAASLTVDTELSSTSTNPVQNKVIDAAVAELKNDLKQSDNELFRVSGYLNQNYVKGRQRYVDSGVEKFINRARWISPAQGEYIELKSGDIIITNRSGQYNFRVCYSTDNKATWTMTGEQTTKFVMPSNAIGWISIIVATTATDDDVINIINNHVIEILRNDTNQVGRANSMANGIIDALEISPNSGFQIEAIKSGTTFHYVNTTATEIGGNEKLFEISCAKDDAFRIKFDFQATISPENIDDYYLIVREINQDETSPLRNVVFKLSELQTAVDFTVVYSNTKKIIANVNLKRSNSTVSTAYNEATKYTITAIKVTEQNDVYTEAGEIWEV